MEQLILKWLDNPQYHQISTIEEKPLTAGGDKDYQISIIELKILILG